MNLKGLHHISAITANAQKNYEFYTSILGMNLVKKTVNQDDWSIYHLFYADKIGNPGTGLTFFEIPFAAQAVHGTNNISRISLRVRHDQALQFWLNRFDKYNVSYEQPHIEAGIKTVYFTDFEKQPLALISDELHTDHFISEPIKHPEIPIENSIIGLGPVTLTVKDIEATRDCLTNTLNFKKTTEYRDTKHENQLIHVFSCSDNGANNEIHLKSETKSNTGKQGRGSVHHIALRVENNHILKDWLNRLVKHRIPNTGIIDRYYFKAIYFKEPNGILFKISTDGPGFMIDEAIDELGESLALPPHLEPKRQAIEENLNPLNTKRTRK